MYMGAAVLLLLALALRVRDGRARPRYGVVLEFRPRTLMRRLYFGGLSVAAVLGCLTIVVSLVEAAPGWAATAEMGAVSFVPVLVLVAVWPCFTITVTDAVLYFGFWPIPHTAVRRVEELAGDVHILFHRPSWIWLLHGGRIVLPRFIWRIEPSEVAKLRELLCADSSDAR